MAWIDISAAPSRASRRRSQCTCEPRPGGTSVRNDLDNPAERVAVLFRRLDLGDHRRRARRVERAHRDRRPTPQHRPAWARIASAPTATPVPIEIVWLTTLMPYACANSRAATSPSATRAAVSRAEARSRIGRASPKAYFCIPTRSACPGRGRVSGRLRPISWGALMSSDAAYASSETGSADITVCHFGHSLLPIMIASGEPRLEPWRTPPRKVTASCSKAIRAPRPNPRRRRANAAPTSAVVTSTPAGSPSIVATSA
jgi:hypothetical protein